MDLAVAARKPPDGTIVARDGEVPVLRAELNVVVADQASVAEGHQIAMAVRGRLMEHVEHLGDAIIHIDPASVSGEARHADSA